MKAVADSKKPEEVFPMYSEQELLDIKAQQKKRWILLVIP